MKIPINSQAAKRLKKLNGTVRRERLRCARRAYELGMWVKDKYPDEPAQWIRVEQVYKDILMDNYAQFPEKP